MMQRADDIKKMDSPPKESGKRHTALKITHRRTNIITHEIPQVPVARKADRIEVFNGGLIINTYSPPKPIKYTQTPSTGGNNNTIDGLNAGENGLGNKSEGLTSVSLSYLHGAQAHSVSNLPPNSTATNVVKKNTFTKTVFQHLAHIEHSNQTVTTSSEHPTLFHGTKMTAKLEENTITASKFYTKIEALNSTIQEHNDSIHVLKLPHMFDLGRFPNNSSDGQKNSANLAIFSLYERTNQTQKTNNPFSILFPLLQMKVVQSLRKPLTRINSLEDATSRLTCTQNALDTGSRTKCLEEKGGLPSDTQNKTTEIAHGNFMFPPHQVRTKRSSNSNPVSNLATSRGESSGLEESYRTDGTEIAQHSSKELPPKYNTQNFPVEKAGWAPGAGAAGRYQPGAGLVPQDMRLQARQAWGSMLGIMWCAAGVIFSGPSLWNVLACLLQAGQAFIG